MHDSALAAGQAFAEKYVLGPGLKVLDVGGRNVNGSLRGIFESLGCEFCAMDMVEHPSVDVVCQPSDPFPFEAGHFDIVISTSCFEHDPMFWMTIREIGRVVKMGGYIYVNMPSKGKYHGYPGDCWRFYKDAGTALAYWSGYKIDGKCYPISVIDQHFEDSSWGDNVTVWQRTENPPAKFM